jgi:carboxynorspermidine decarboxylase
MAIDWDTIPSPCFVLDESKLKANLEVLAKVQAATGVKIILALKGFAMFSTFKIISQYLSGTTASSLNEAKLAHDEFGEDIHVYSPVYLPSEINEILAIAKHITFNSLSEYQRHRELLESLPKKVSAGIRINPEYSEVKTDLYNPCVAGSRLGVRAKDFDGKLPEGIEGLHSHNLCENNSYALEKTLASIEDKFAMLLPKLKWLNLGGGHLITEANYNVEHLIAILKGFRARHPHLEIILEPGAAIAWQTGYLLSTVLDIVESEGINIAMLDVSVSAHMPDCLEMPYKPRIIGGKDPAHDNQPKYRIGGLTCLAGDQLSEYSFEKPLKRGDKIIFEDMMHYTMVKTTMFNGVNLPSIGIWQENNSFKLVKSFGYQDYRSRLS